MSSAATFTDFWDKLGCLEGEEEEAVDFMKVEMAHRPEVIFSKNAEGLSLTEFLCQLPPNPEGRDTLVDLISKKVPVTQKCYTLLLDSANVNECGWVEMLAALLESKFLPDSLYGKKPLDAIVDVFEDSEDLADDIGYSIKRINLQVGVTHEAGGSFEVWYEQDSSDKE